MINQFMAAAAGVITMFGGTTTDGGAHANMQMHDRMEHRHGTTTSIGGGGPVNPICIAAAVSTREASLGAAVTTLNSDVSSAYSSRASALAAGYALTDKTSIHTAVRNAWQTFGAALKLGRKSWQSAREGAWTQFRAAAKACGASGDSSISDGGNASMESGNPGAGLGQ